MLVGGMLDLDDFSQTTDENLTISEFANFYRFDLDEGTWSGVDTAFLNGNGSSTLIAFSNSVTDVSISDSLGIDLDVEFQDIDLSQLNSASIVTSGDIGQSALSAIVAPALFLSGNDIDLSNAGNDFDSVSLDANSASLVDIDRLEISDANIVDKIDVQAAGVDLTGAIAADRLWIDSTQGVTQIVSSSVVVDEMLLTGQGDFAISSSLNDVSELAADIDGDLEVNVLTGTNVSSFNCNGTVFCGVNVGGDLNIFSSTGDITQDAGAAIIVGGDSFFTTQAGDVCLSGGDCDGDGVNDNDFNRVSILSAGEVEIADADGLTLIGLQADRAAIISGQSVPGLLTLDGNIVIADQLLLQSSNGVEQVGGTVSTNELLLSGNRVFVIDNSANAISLLAADINGSLDIASSTDVLIDSLEYNSNCSNLSVVICGLNVSADLKIFLVDSDLNQSATASVIVGGDAFLTTTNGDICLAGGDCDGDGVNDNRIGGSVFVSATGEVVVAENDDVFISQADGNGSFRFIGNNIQVNTNIVGADLLLQASDGVSLNGSMIDVNNLLLTGSGEFELLNFANSIDNFAADVDGTIRLASGTDLNIASLTFESVCTSDVEVCGVTVTEDLLIALDNSDLKQSAAVVVGGLTTLQVGSGDICLSFGDCDSDGQNDNDFNELDIVAANEVEIADVNDVSITGLNVDGDAAIIAGQSAAGKVTLDGNLTSDRLLLQASDGVEQVSGSVVVDDIVLDGSGNFHLCLDNSIGSTTTAGRISADVDGDVYVRNGVSVELVDQSFTTKSGAVVSHSQFNVSGDLTVSSDATNSTAIVDSTQINVAGESSFEATGTGGDIVVDDLNVAGPIGVSTVAGDVTIVNQHANGIVFRNDDIPGVAATEVCAHFEESIVNGSLFAQATQNNIANEANASLEVNGVATLIAGTTNVSNVTGSNNEFDIALGLEASDNIRFDVLSASSNQASIELDGSVVFADTAIGTPSSIDANGGTLFLTVDGSVAQSAGVLLSADNVAIDAAGHLILADVDADQIALSSNGFVDTALLSDTPGDLPDDDGDLFAPRHTSVDGEYGIIVTSQNDLTVTTVSDALNLQQDLTGISADAGHAFLQTVDGASIQFDGRGNTDTIFANGITFGLAADLQNGHVLTTIAGGDLTIEDNTVLRSTSGTVTDISTFTTDEGVEFENVSMEGPLFSLFLPTPSDDPTTRTVNTDDSQFIGLNFGRAGEQNFIVEVNWADGVFDVLNFDSDVGNRFERISHTFTNQFLLENFELPTFLNFFNDPAINLFDTAGQASLNGDTTDLNTNDNFVLAFSDSRPQGDLEVASVTRPDAIIRDSIIPMNDDQLSSETEASDFGQMETVVEEETSDAYLVRLDDAGLEIKETRQELEESGVTQDVVSQLKRRVEEGTQYPPGQYRINWTEGGVSFSIEFEKGAEEDLGPGELEPVVEELPDSDAPVDTNELESTPEEESPVVAPASNVQNDDRSSEEELDIVIENVKQPSRADLIASGAIAIGLMRSNSKRDEELAEELSKLGSAGDSISFSKSARIGRKIGG